MKFVRLSVKIVMGSDVKWHVVTVTRFTMSSGVVIEKDTVLGRFEDKENARAFCAQICADIVFVQVRY